MPDITFDRIISYLENLCESHVDVKSNFRWNVEEAEGAMRNGIGYPVALIDSPQIVTSGDYSKRFHGNNTAITVLAEPDSRITDEYISQNEILNNCLNICYEFEKRIIADSRIARIDGEKNWLYGLVDINAFQFFKMGPLFSDMLYGYRMEILIKNSVSGEVEKEKWSDLTPVVPDEGFDYELDMELN